MRVLVYFFIAIIFSGCAKVVDSFVEGGTPGKPSVPVSSDLSNNLKLSPGMVRSSSGNLSMTAHITTNRHVMTGNNVSAIIGLHRSR